MLYDMDEYMKNSTSSRK